MEQVKLTPEQAIVQAFKEVFEGNIGIREREDALGKFMELGLPAHKNEEYKFTPIRRILEKNFGLQEVPSSEELTSVEKYLYTSAGSHLVFINGRFDESLSTWDDKLNITSVSSPQNGEVQNPSSFYYLNQSLAQNALVIKASTAVEEPVFIYQLFVGNTPEIISNPRIEIEVINQGSLTLFEKLIQETDAKVFSNAITSINVSANSEANYTKIQNVGKSFHLHDELYVKQARDSRFYVNTFSFKGALIRNNINISLDDENCETHMHGLYLVNGKTHVDNHTSVDHRKPNSYSNELYKGIIDEQATAVFNGKIFVRPGAQQTNAFQSNNNISLSEDATIHTKPQLEIWADDVKCSHGCTVGQLDEEALFYLRSRGLDKNAATAMMLNAFAQDVLEYVCVEETRNEITEIINSRLG